MRDLIVMRQKESTLNVLRARDLMSRPVRRLTMEARVRDAADFLLRMGISGAPVVDAHGRWQGVFSLNDLARHVQGRIVDEKRSLENRDGIPQGINWQGLEEARVAELMTYGCYTVGPEATLEEVARTLVSQQVHRVFVISDDGRELLGVITTMDVLRWLDRALHQGP